MISLQQLEAWACILIVCTTAAVVDAPKKYEGIPPKAKAYVSLFEEISRNSSMEMAQTEQESAWDVRARSAFANGLRQFTPSTGRWAARTICAKLGSYKPYNANWSIRCGVIYQEWLERKTNYNHSYCFNRAVGMMRYNGGGHILKELRRSKLVNNKYSFVESRKHCRRAKWACKENYEYAPRIFKKQPKYTQAGVTGIQCTGE